MFQVQRDLERKTAASRLGNLFLPLALAVIIAVCAFISPPFLTQENLKNVIIGSATFGILACGMTMVLVTGEVDLSVGSQVALTSVIVATLAPKSLALAVVAAVVATTLVGLANGILLTKTAMPSFVLTLGTMGIVRSMALVIADGQPVYGVPQSFTALTSTMVGKIPLVGVAMVVMYALTWFLLRYTSLGRSIYAVGSSSESARLSGISARQVKIAVYAMSGFLAGIAGLFYTSYVTLGLPDGGVDYETQAITAAIIGGTSFFGGEGEVHNTFLGLFIVGTVKNILNLMGVSPFVQPVAIGILIITAVVLRTRKSE